MTDKGAQKNKQSTQEYTNKSLLLLNSTPPPDMTSKPMVPQQTSVSVS